MTDSATFLDGWSLAELPVRVELTATGVRVVDEAGKERAHWAAEGLFADGMQEGGVLHVSHASAPHETLVVRDRALEARILALCDQKRVARLPGGNNKLRFALSALAGIVGLGALLYWYTPAIARWTARRIPVEHERMLGTQMTALLEHLSCEDEAAEGVLAMLAGRLAAPIGKTPELEYEVRIIKSEGENAFALPGGTIMMTSGFLRGASSDSEIAGVLAHEIEHVAQRHVLAGFLRDAVLSALWAVALGDYAGLMVVDPTTVYRVATLEFSRADEEEADRGAIARLHRASLRHTGLIAFFERAKKEHGDDEGLSWLSTHPSHADRIATLRKTPDVPTSSAKPALSEAQLQALRAACQDASVDEK